MLSAPKAFFLSIALAVSACGPGSDAVVLGEDQSGIASTEAALGRRGCEANFTINEVDFTGFVELGEVKGFGKKGKCQKLAIENGPLFLGELLLKAGFQEKASRPSNNTPMNSGVKLECGQTLTMYADTRVEGKETSRDVEFPVEISCSDIFKN